ncbi:TlpA family protein disulfide reductase [Bergeyella sp. RCAD1439]|uniref:TlpA family protein disulfide reductase n=1 Tax=Bergeyella anatis TaxID=3113737 RepID=UPI002E191B2C|nr:TlpA family protein disulfide reductase [Bergeyella sp. RCAD1439]
MKKLLMLSSFALLLTACQKDKAETTTAETTKAKTEISALKEYTPEQVSELLKTQNDTLYVTNFFATWCGPCMREMPHFREKIKETEGQPIKFTFVSLDDRKDWNTKVKQFADQFEMKNVILTDGAALDPTFFENHFQTWDGSSIPFTIMKKGDKTEEIVGMLTKSDLDQKIAAFGVSQK